MKIKLYQIDAFAKQVFQGNPAAVVPLEYWLEDKVLQAIAQENNLSETAFFVELEMGYELRWFTPNSEVDLCGHATLAAAYVIFNHLSYEPNNIVFNTRSGPLIVSREGSSLSMNFPATMPEVIEAPKALIEGLNGIHPQAVLAGFDYVVVLANHQEVAAVNPKLSQWLQLDKRGVIVTALGEDCDFVSRCFYPKLNVDEDPVTGSAHCLLTPYWAKQLNKTSLVAKQLSKRSGVLSCQLDKQRVVLVGQCADYLLGEITIS
ncbi:PhzF family phenazine biosynthesis protein [Thalassotalea ganghwensis]